MKILRVKLKYPHCEPEYRLFRVEAADLDELDSHDKSSLVELLVDLCELEEVESDFVKSVEIYTGEAD